MEETSQAEGVARIEINSQTTGAPKSCIRILHVDDDRCLLEVSKQILSMENNFEIDIATSVDEALTKIEKQPYDAIVSDYEMPLKNGLDFLRELSEQQKNIPFILFTGKGREEVIVEALNLGADSYINKNGSPEIVYCELADAINKTVERKKARELLITSESKYRTLVEKSLQGIIITLAAPLKLAFANEAMGNMLGYSVKELLSLSPEGIMSLVYPEDRAVFFKRMEDRVRGEPAESSYEFRAVRKNGSIVWMIALANRVEYDGQPAVQGMFLDITERKKSEETLRKSEERYRELANSLPEIVFEADLTGKITFFSQRAFEITGYTKEELEKGLNMMQFVVPEEKERVKENMKKSLVGEDLDVNEYTLFRKNGTIYPALVRTTPIISENKAIGLRGLVWDISERKKIEKAIQESEGKLRAIFEGASDGIILADLKTRNFVFANPRICEITGYSLKELLKLNVSDIHPQKDLPSVIDQFTKQAQGKMSLAANIPVLRKDGTIIYCDVNSRPAKIGEQEYLIGFFRDITDRRKAEEAVSASLKRYQSFIEVTGELGWTTNAAGEVVEDVPFFRNFTGQTYEEVKGCGWTNAVHPDDMDHVIQAWQAAVAAKTNYEVEYRLRRRDGVYRNFLVRGAPIFEENGKIREWVGTCIDITDHKKAEENLKESEEKFRNLAEESPNMIFINKQGRVVYANKKCEDITGYTREEFYSPSFNFFALCAPEYVEVMKKAYNRHMKGEVVLPYEYVMVTRDGKRIGVIITTKLIDYEGEKAILGIVTDITERKNAEEALNQTMDELVRVNEKLNVVGSLTRHDVRNKLCTITANAYMLKKKHSDQPDIIDGLGKIEQTCKEIVKIFDFARTYEQLGVEELTQINVEKTLNEASALFWFT